MLVKRYLKTNSTDAEGGARLGQHHSPGIILPIYTSQIQPLKQRTAASILITRPDPVLLCSKYSIEYHIRVTDLL
jgi:hypothetical protein